MQNEVSAVIRYGSVIKLFAERGFGFIQEDGGGSLFTHAHGVVGRHWDDVRVGDRVTFTEIPSAKGPRAVNVRLRR
jgi:cold shock protein